MLKRLVQVSFIVAVIMVTAVVAVNLKHKGTATDPYRAFSVFAKVYNIVKARYVEPVDESFLMEGAFRGAVESVFDQNSYIPAGLMGKLQERLTRSGSVGIRVIKRNGYAQVVHVVPDSEAARQGITPGTIIQKINGQYTWDLPLFAIRALLKGTVDEAVTITYYAMEKGEDVDIDLHFAEITEPPFREIRLGETDALQVLAFSPELLKRASELATEQNRLVLDLRYCQDDHYTDMLRLAAAIRGKQALATKRRKNDSETLTASPGDVHMPVPVVLLTSSYTMNAADVLANLLQGQENVTLMGTPTSGKAFSSEVFELENRAYVELATVFYEPSQKDGRKPDIRSYIDDSELAPKLESFFKELKETDDSKTAA